MKITSNISNNYEYPILKSQVSCNSQPAFEGAKSRKFIEQLVKAKCLNKVKATFQDMVDAYNELGYVVISKRGSHASVQIGNFSIPLVIPHKDKYVAPIDLKRLRFVALGKFAEARNAR